MKTSGSMQLVAEVGQARFAVMVQGVVGVVMSIEQISGSGLTMWIHGWLLWEEGGTPRLMVGAVEWRWVI